MSFYYDFFEDNRDSNDEYFINTQRINLLSLLMMGQIINH